MDMFAPVCVCICLSVCVCVKEEIFLFSNRCAMNAASATDTGLKQQEEKDEG